jgi:hypothetical protein
MTTTRWLILLFWVVVFGMLLKQCHDTDMARQQAVQSHPAQTHFFFTPPPPPPAAPPPPSQGADVHQIKFEVQENTPGPGSFTCLVTVQNLGRARAKNVQVRVNPYYGGHKDDEGGRINDTRLSANDPAFQVGTWVGFPDLDPGETSTRSATFLAEPHVEPGYNSQPQVTFETVQ